MLLKNKNKCATGEELIYDEACIDIINTIGGGNVTIAGQYAECEGCDYMSFTELAPNTTTSLLINTKYTIKMHVISNNQTYCSWNEELFEHYRYGWNLSIDNNCDLYIKQTADNEYLPILSAFIILFFFGTIWYMVKCIYKCTKNTLFVQRLLSSSGSALQTDLGNTADSTPLVVESPPLAHKHPHRLKSIDVFRGLCIILMIFVNYGGGQYWCFRHSIWNGLTVADLIFPWFIWVMGLSYSISLNKKLQRAVPRRELIFLVLRRSFVLVLLGLILNSHGKPVSLSSLRIPGVLQQIGIVYLLIGVVESLFTKRSLSEYEFGRFNIIKDILVALPQWSFVLLCVFVHTMVTFVAYIPGCGRGYLGPGGLHEHAKFANCTGGAAGYIDRAIFGEHMYKYATCHAMYETKQYFDPEGILSILTCVFLGYLGFQAGRIYHVYTTPMQKTIRWLIWGVILCLIGGLLCNFSKNGGIIPLNKNMWSLSYVLVLGGLAYLIEACLYILVDVKRKWGGRPFFYPGMNPLILYIGHELFRNTFPFCWKLDNETHAEYLGMNLWGTALWVAISIFLYKRNIFINI